MPKRTTVTCGKCQNLWSTKAKTPAEAVCPKCSAADRAKRSDEDARDYAAKLELREQKRIAKAEYAKRIKPAKVAPAPPDPGDKRDVAYRQTDANRFVRLLCCCTFPDPDSAVHRRDKNDYREALENLIAVNKTRTGDVGKWETQAARKALAALR